MIYPDHLIFQCYIIWGTGSAVHNTFFTHSILKIDTLIPQTLYTASKNSVEAGAFMKEKRKMYWHLVAVLGVVVRP